MALLSTTASSDSLLWQLALTACSDSLLWQLALIACSYSFLWQLPLTAWSPNLLWQLPPTACSKSFIWQLDSLIWQLALTTWQAELAFTTCFLKLQLAKASYYVCSVSSTSHKMLNPYLFLWDTKITLHEQWQLALTASSDSLISQFAVTASSNNLL